MQLDRILLQHWQSTLIPDPRFLVPPRAAFGLVIAICGLAPSLAHARERNRVAVEVSLSAGVHHIPAMPTLQLAPDFASNQTTDLVLGTPATFGGVEGGIALSYGDRTIVHLFNLGISHTVGSAPLVLSSARGREYQVSLASVFRFDVALFGIGHRWTHKRAAIEVSASPVFAVFSGIQPMYADGAGLTPSTLKSSTVLLGVRIDLDICRRLDPQRRVCAELSASPVEGRLFNGLGFGVKMEWGT